MSIGEVFKRGTLCLGIWCHSVERGHLADWYQNFAKDLNHSNQKVKENH